MLQAKLHDTVKVHYTGSFKDGTVFDTSLEREPFQFTIGEGMVIPGFEKGVIGMSVGETKVISVPPDEAYGEYSEEFVVLVDRSQIPSHIHPEPGMVLQVHSPKGDAILVTVLDMDDTNVRLDANHPFAGKELVFEVKLIEIF